MTKIQRLKWSLPSGEKISRQLERMLSSQDFHASPQQIAFLEFVVNQNLADRAGSTAGKSDR